MKVRTHMLVQTSKSSRAALDGYSPDPADSSCMQFSLHASEDASFSHIMSFNTY